ncbi:hypothetical protein HYH03_015956 [Edaphochlamys debaryana]|uniref:Uncharacterized protein n=1 Tax=Edaphochlamys debaryana TaxID=47281 RepID=A0A835XK21_9CHLO|nr:hypothetical protein HYH03_015956 [Edaphochlamys debaryana]|eukprot:KAG2485281.1 hypothetical protein HYH03_015956 [Edaphochlamys debaryana]
MALHSCALRHSMGPCPRPRAVTGRAAVPLRLRPARAAPLQLGAAAEAPSRTAPDRSPKTPPPPPPGSIPLRCKGGESVHALPSVLGCASPVLRTQLSASPSEVQLEGDDAETWATALRLLDPKTHPQAAVLSWSNLEPVLRLADKYDSAVLRVLCVTYMTCNQADLSLNEQLPSPKNPLIAVTLLEQCCGQPELEPYTQTINKVLQKALETPEDTNSRRALLSKLKALLMSPLYMKLVSPSVQARVMATLVSVMEVVMAAPPTCRSCGRQHTGTTNGGQWQPLRPLQPRRRGAEASLLASASPVLRDSLALPLLASGELRLEQDDAATWGTALRLLDPRTHAEAAELSWANLEPVLRLADKYDSAVLRAMCATYVICSQADLSLNEPLPSPKNPLIAASLLERFCAQPELRPYTKRIGGVLARALAPPKDILAARALLAKLKGLLTSPSYVRLVSPSVQARVMAVLVSIMEGCLRLTAGVPAAGPGCPCRRCAK